MWRERCRAERGITVAQELFGSPSRDAFVPPAASWPPLGPVDTVPEWA